MASFVNGKLMSNSELVQKLKRPFYKPKRKVKPCIYLLELKDGGSHFFRAKSKKEAREHVKKHLHIHGKLTGKKFAKAGGLALYFRAMRMPFGR